MAPSGAGLARGILARVRSLPDHALIDRLVRGRVWIPLLGVMLAGIVAMQVEVLKLGSSMGRWVERGSALAARNAELRASVATLSGDQRIERIAAGMGMQMPAPTELDFVSLGSQAQVSRALAGIHAPDATQFLASLPPTNPQPGAVGSGLASTLAPGSTAAASTASTGGGTGSSSSPAASTTSSSATTGGAGTTPSSSTSGGSTSTSASPAPSQSQTGASQPPTGTSQSSTGTSQSQTGASQSPTGAAGLPTTQSSGGG